MAKLAVFGAFLIALLALAQASRLTVTTIITEQEEQQQMQCEEQMRPQSLRLRSCQQYLMAPAERQETGEQHLGMKHEKEVCCEGLKNMNEQCRCEAMTAVVKDIEAMERLAERGPGPQQGHQQQMREAMERIRDAASDLPNQCNIGGPRKCQMEEQQQQQPQVQQGQCEEQLRQQSSRLRSCQQLLLPPSIRQQTGVQQTVSEHEKRECCAGLQNIQDQQCRCEAMRAVVKDIEQQMERMAERSPGPQRGQEQQMREVLQRIRDAASDLPNQCSIGGPQRCQMEQPSLIRMFRS